MIRHTLRLFSVLALAAFGSSALATPYSDLVLGDGPVRYYRLGDPSGGPAVDATGTSDGTYSGFSLADHEQAGALTGDPDGAAGFDGIDNLVTAPHAADLNITGDLTLELWMYKTAEAADWQRMLGKGEPTVRTYGLWEETGAGQRLLFQQYNGGGAAVFNVFSTTTTELNQWYHIVGTVSGSAATLYVNGVADAVGTRTGAVGTDTAPLTIGVGSVHTFFPGRLDEIAIYNRALSPAEVLAHYNVGITGIPEPSSFLLFAIGLVGLGGFRRRRRY